MWIDIILYIKKANVSTKKLLELINEFSKVEGYKIDILKSVIFLYSKNELSGRDSRKTGLFNDASKRIKYLRINLVK